MYKIDVCDGERISENYKAELNNYVETIYIIIKQNTKKLIFQKGDVVHFFDEDLGENGDFIVLATPSPNLLEVKRCNKTI